MSVNSARLRGGKSVVLDMIDIIVVDQPQIWGAMPIRGIRDGKTVVGERGHGMPDYSEERQRSKEVRESGLRRETAARGGNPGS